MTAAELLRDARERHGLSQASLARRARTTARQIGRIERGETSPSVGTLTRLLMVMGEELQLGAVPGAVGNQTDAELRAAMRLSPPERIQQAATLSRTLTSLAARAGAGDE